MLDSTEPRPNSVPAEPVQDRSSERAGSILLVVRDLFFRVKLEAGLRHLGLTFRRLEGNLLGAANAERPALVILDLSDDGLDPLETIRALRATDEGALLPVVGFVSHVDRERRSAALEAGCTVVVSRSRISGGLAQVLEPFLRGSTDVQEPGTGGATL